MSNRILPVLIVSAAMAFITAAMAQSPATPNLPGHLKEEDKVLKSSTAVAVVTLIGKGALAPGPPTVMEYWHSKFRVNEPLLGELGSEIDASFFYTDYPVSKAEIVPVDGTQYIVFLRPTKRRRGEADYEVLKFSAYSQEEVDKLKKLIKELPQPSK